MPPDRSDEALVADLYLDRRDRRSGTRASGKRLIDTAGLHRWADRERQIENRIGLDAFSLDHGLPPISVILAYKMAVSQPRSQPSSAQTMCGRYASFLPAEGHCAHFRHGEPVARRAAHVAAGRECHRASTVIRAARLKPGALHGGRALVALRSLASAFRGVNGRLHAAPKLYPLVAGFRPALISFCTQISAAPVTGSLLPGSVAQPFFAIMSPRS